MPDEYDYESGVYNIETVVTKYHEIKDKGKSDAALRPIILTSEALAVIQEQCEMKKLRGINSV